jgi:hypothetical protein
MLVYTRVGRARADRVPREKLTHEMELQIRESDAMLIQQIESYKQQKEQLMELIEARKRKCTQFIDATGDLEEIKVRDARRITHQMCACATPLARARISCALADLHPCCC